LSDRSVALVLLAHGPMATTRSPSLRDHLTPAAPGSINEPECYYPNHSVLTTTLIAGIESVQLPVLNQKESLVGTGKSANWNTDYLEATVFTA